ALSWAAPAAVRLEDSARQPRGFERGRAKNDTEPGEAVHEIPFIEEHRKELSRHDVADDELALGARPGQYIDPRHRIRLALRDGDQHRGVDRGDHRRRRGKSTGPP